MSEIAREPSAVGEVLREPAVRVVRVALAGCGVVGGELVRLLQTHRAAIEREQRVRLELVRVLVRNPDKPRPPELPPTLLTTDPGVFLGTSADVVVEAIGGLDPAERIARSTLERGARLVTANKALIAARGDALAALARERRGRIDFEAAVGGGVPVIRVLRDACAQGPVHRIRAILNGTANYILTLLERGVPFERALSEAQRKGFAEADPTRDLDGTDASDKIRILAWLAYGIAPDTLPVRRRGIMPDPDRLARDAEAVGGSVRLVAECACVDGELSASVEPVIVSSDSQLGRTVEEQNHVSVDFGWSRPVGLSGPGAGGIPTASALLSDVLRPSAPVPPEAWQSPAPLLEDRPHAWVVSAANGGGDLRESLTATGLEAEAFDADPAAERVLVLRCGWSRLNASLRVLETAGRRPLATRVDLAEISGAGVPDRPLAASSY